MYSYCSTCSCSTCRHIIFVLYLCHKLFSSARRLEARSTLLLHLDKLCKFQRLDRTVFEEFILKILVLINCLFQKMKKKKKKTGGFLKTSDLVEWKYGYVGGWRTTFKVRIESRSLSVCDKRSYLSLDNCNYKRKTESPTLLPISALKFQIPSAAYEYKWRFCKLILSELASFII